MQHRRINATGAQCPLVAAGAHRCLVPVPASAQLCLVPNTLSAFYSFGDGSVQLVCVMLAHRIMLAHCITLKQVQHDTAERLLTLEI